MNKRNSLLVFVSITLLMQVNTLLVQTEQNSETKPNIIIIYTDDQGYGDVSAHNPEAKFNTPNTDRLLNEGLTFTDVQPLSNIQQVFENIDNYPDGMKVLLDCSL